MDRLIAVFDRLVRLLPAQMDERPRDVKPGLVGLESNGLVQVRERTVGVAAVIQ